MRKDVILSTIILLVTLSVSVKAEQVACDDSLVGRFENELVSNNPDFYQWNSRQSVVIYKNSEKDAFMRYQFYARIDIPCGSKVLPAVYELTCEKYYETSPKMKLMESGSSQCSLSSRAVLDLDSDLQTLSVRSGIVVPIIPEGLSYDAAGLVYKLQRDLTK